MDQLWSPWRHAYVTGSVPRTDAPGCVFCAAPNEPAELSLVVHRGSHNYVILNRYPYNVGHVMVLPYRHVPSLVDLSASELHEFAELSQKAEAGTDRGFRAERHQRRHQPGAVGRGGTQGASAPAHGAAVDRRHQLHERVG